MKRIEIILLLMLQFIIAQNDIYRENSFLFSLYKHVNPLIINEDFSRTQNNEINSILIKYDVNSIEPWLKSATENDFDKDIYNRRMKIEFVQKIRDQKQFSSKNSLIEQMQIDIDTIRNILTEQK